MIGDAGPLFAVLRSVIDTGAKRVRLTREDVR
jgi:hypothetical protein